DCYIRATQWGDRDDIAPPSIDRGRGGSLSWPPELPPESPMTDPIGLARGLTNYGDRDFALYLRRSFAKSMGYSSAMLAKPVIGIANTASGFNNCHRLVPELVEAVKRGVLAAGALPIEFPTISLGEVYLNPTSLMFR